MKLQRLTQIGKRIIGCFTLTGYVNFQRLGYVPIASLYTYTLAVESIEYSALIHLVPREFVPTCGYLAA